MSKQYLLGLIVIGLASLSFSKEYHVAKVGKDSNNGSPAKPFLTISKAAEIAQPGDTVTVHEGVYRERVNPPRGGSSESTRILYRAAPKEKVEIKGSEVVNTWEKEGELWKVEIQDSFFGEVNPFKTTIKNPQYVDADEGGKGLGWLTYGIPTLRGDVYINGEALTQIMGDSAMKTMSWRRDSLENSVVIHADFGELDPNKELTEINVRMHTFTPEEEGINFITVRGFHVMHVANHWAPPTVYQPGAIEPHAGTHWIIEDNIISYAKGLGVSLGIPKSSPSNGDGHGHHIVRNNRITRCGQGGIAGQYFADDSKILNNYIAEINYRGEFGGWETSGIKFHHNDRTLIEGNFIYHIYKPYEQKNGAAHGIWIDYDNTQIVLRNNVIHETSRYPLLLEANYGPIFVINNIMTGHTEQMLGILSSQTGVWMHNMFIHVIPDVKQQTYGGRPANANDRFYNNIFFHFGSENVTQGEGYVMDYNLYLEGSRMGPLEGDNSTRIEFNTLDTLLWDSTTLTFDITMPEGIATPKTTYVTKELIDLPAKTPKEMESKQFPQKDLIFPDSLLVEMNVDFLGVNRSDSMPMWGPFEEIKPGKNQLKLFELPELVYEPYVHDGDGEDWSDLSSSSTGSNSSSDDVSSIESSSSQIGGDSSENNSSSETSSSMEEESSSSSDIAPIKSKALKTNICPEEACQVEVYSLAGEFIKTYSVSEGEFLSESLLMQQAYSVGEGKPYVVFNLKFLE